MDRESYRQAVAVSLVSCLVIIGAALWFTGCAWGRSIVQTSNGGCAVTCTDGDCIYSKGCNETNKPYVSRDGSVVIGRGVTAGSINQTSGIIGGVGAIVTRDEDGVHIVGNDTEVEVGEDERVNIVGNGNVIRRAGRPKERLAKCPCDGRLECKCNWATGVYSFSDGCNTTTCNAFGICTSTLAMCWRDWRGKEAPGIVVPFSVIGSSANWLQIEVSSAASGGELKIEGRKAGAIKWGQ